MFLPGIVQSTAHFSCMGVTLQAVDEHVFKIKSPPADL